MWYIHVHVCCTPETENEVFVGSNSIERIRYRSSWRMYNTYVRCMHMAVGRSRVNPRYIFVLYCTTRYPRERERETTHEVSYTHAACRKYLILRGNKRCKFQIFFSLFFFSWDFRWIIYMKLLNDKNAVDRYARSLRKRETAGIFFFFC